MPVPRPVTLPIAGVMMLLVRLRRTPPSAARQQIKWALFGFSGYSLFLSIALWWGIGNGTGRGWSALIVFAIWLVIAIVLGLLGKKAVSEVRGLDRTTETISKIPPALKGHEEQNR